MKFNGILHVISMISEWSGKIAAFIIIPNILALVYEVVARYVFNKPTIWSFEVTYFLYAGHFMLGAAYTLKYHRHIRVDVFYSRFSPRSQAMIDSIGYLVLFFPAILILIYGGIGLVQESLLMNERSAITAWKPILWPFKAMLPFAFLLLGLQGIVDFIGRFNVAIGRAK
ncbi:MAG: TRAP transporter small permease subunit [Bacillota bacterium]